MAAYRPGILTAIAIVGIVLGAGGVLGALGGIASAPVQDVVLNAQDVDVGSAALTAFLQVKTMPFLEQTMRTAAAAESPPGSEAWFNERIAAA